MELRHRLSLLKTAVLLGLLSAPGAPAKVFETQAAALARVFPPPAQVTRATAFLTAEQKARAAKLAEAPVESAVVTRYGGFTASGEAIGTAYFDTHTVRTAPEVLMIVVGPDRTVRSVDVLAFAEPEDYLPREGWLKRLDGRRQEEGLFVGRALAHVTGATLTTRAIAAAVRRILALDSILGPPAAPGKKP